MFLWFAFPVWPRILNISSCIYWPFVLPLLRTVQFICLFIQQVFDSLQGYFLSSLCILVINLLSKIFYHFAACLFSLVTVSFAVQKLFSFMQYHWSILSLNYWTIGVLFRKLLPLWRIYWNFDVISWNI
jgi:hypothetical protein